MNTCRQLKIGFIEVGHFHSRMFTGYIHTSSPHKIVAISDKDKDVARRESDALGCPAYTDYRELLEKEEPDFIFSFGRHNEMAEILDVVLDKEIPVCTEKPVTGRSRTMMELNNKAKRKGLFTDVALPLRFSPVILALNEWRAAHDIGEIIHCYFRNMAGSIQRYIDWGNDWMLEKKSALGGPFMNEGAHYIDLFRHLTGEEVKWVCAGMNNHIYGKDIEDNFSAIMETATGKRCVIEICYGFPTAVNWRDFACVINTTKYLFTLIDRESPREFRLEVRSRSGNAIEELNLLKYNQNCYGMFIDETLNRYLAGNRGVVPFDYFLGTVRVLESCYQASAGKAVIQL